MTTWFFVSLEFKRNDVADIAWGLGFVVVAWSAFALANILGEVGVRGFVVNILVSVWGIRLSSHVFLRNRKKNEDKRYLGWRTAWGKWFLLRSYVQVYMLQGFFMFVISAPMLWVHSNDAVNLGLLGFAGIGIWIIGFLFEAIGDAQLAWHLRNPVNSGHTLMTGLWKYTRHPNYFGEALQWWGIWFIASELPYGWATVLGPLTITYLIVFVSGIPMLERAMAGRADFESYKIRTSKFIPLPPKRLG